MTKKADNTDLNVTPKMDAVDRATAAYTAKLRKQAVFWGVSAIIFGLFLYGFRTVLLPFLAGMVIAYFLDPIADRLEKLGFSRLLATTTILVITIGIIVLAFMILVPVLLTQLSQFLERLPEYTKRLEELVQSIKIGPLDGLIGEATASAKSNISGIIQQGAGLVGTVLQSVWSSGMALVNLAGLLVVTPVVAFYMLLDWDRMTAKIDSWVPRDDVETVRGIARDIDKALAGFLRGQGTVCLILGTIYAVGLSLVGLNFGLLIGMFAGLISFIPYVGSMIGLIIALAVALVQFWPDYIMIIAVAAVFFGGQFVEGNFLQPKLVGESVGLHPVWLMFALFAFGAVFGFVGLLVAVPAAAAVGVLVRFALKQYLASPLYKGH